jgi:hypothetical protein
MIVVFAIVIILFTIVTYDPLITITSLSWLLYVTVSMTTISIIFPIFTTLVSFALMVILVAMAIIFSWLLSASYHGNRLMLMLPWLPCLLLLP